MNNKKLRERAIVEAFLRSQGLPASALIDADRESPDAVIEVNGVRVGVEIVTLIEAVPRQNVPPQRWTVEARRVVALAQRLFESRHPTALVVSFAFQPTWVPDRNKALHLAEKLVRLVEEHAPHEILAGQRGDRPFQLRLQDSVVSWLYVGATNPSLGGRWQPGLAGLGRYASAADIEATIIKKERLAETYAQAVEPVWLLIDCDLAGQEICLQLPDSASPIALASRFERVFCFGFGFWQFVEIPLGSAA